MYTFGKNMYGQLGVQGTNIISSNVPTKLKLERGSKAASASCGEEHASLLSTEHQVYTWGYGNDGQLG